jgi:ATP-dependent Clp protease ATP-binding subunit ClpX
VALDGLGRSELVDIMTKPRNSLLSQYQTLFKASGIDLQMPRSALEWVADQAMHSNTGARGLKSILETHLSPILFERSSAVWGHKGPAPSNEVVFDPETGNQAFKIREA